MAGGSADSGRSVTSRVAAILMAFHSGDTHSLTELARLAQLPVSTTHRLTYELVSRRVLERTGDGYRAGLALRMMGTVNGPRRSTPLLGRAAGMMADLAATTDSRVRLGVLDGVRVAVAETRPGAGLVHGFDAPAVPTHATALGRVLLAFSPVAVVDEILGAGLTRFTEHTLTDPDRLRRALAITRLTRLAVSRGEYKIGEGAVAVPVFGTGGSARAAMEVAIPDLRSGLERVRGALMVAAASLSRQLATAITAEPERDVRSG